MMAMEIESTAVEAPSLNGATQGFDGVICFGGGDWWYHNRGHYDMQMMRHLMEHVPVLYVNSIGIRVPRIGEGRMFFERVFRKLRSLSRGFRKVDDRWATLSPIVVPGSAGMTLTRHFLPHQVKRAARRMGINRPLVWVTCPPAASAVDHLDPVAVVYQRTDRWEEFPLADAEAIRAIDRSMKQRADFTLFCATLLYDEESPACRSPLYLDHGVDFNRFVEADRAAQDPPDVAELPRPRVGFVGGIDDHTFDRALFNEVARLLPEVTFVLVGGCSLPEDWCEHDHVALLGRKPYAEVASYMAAMDILIMPWRQNEWIKACNPVKLKEYLAVGRPIISTPFPELARYDGFVHIAQGASDFADAIRAGLAEECDRDAMRRRVECETWRAKSDSLLGALMELSFEPAPTNTDSMELTRERDHP